MIDWIYYLILLFTLLSGLWFNILGLPGLWLMVLAHAVYGWLTGWEYVGWSSIIAMVVLGLIAELIEFVAGSAGAKTAGGSKRGMVGAIVGGLIGGIAGTPLFPVIGTVIGAIAGFFAGALAVELLIGKSMDQSMRVGIGAAKGRFWGIISKTFIGIIMLIVGAITALPFSAAAPTPVTPPSQTTQPASPPMLEPPDPTTLPAM
jgi:uncharacterized protein